MLPKPEKISKKKLKSENEELPQVSEQEVKAATLRKKRLVVGIGLGLTVILSISFSIYRYLKTTHLSLPQINPPTLNINKQSTSLSSILDKELSRSNHSWNLLINNTSDNQVHQYSNSKTNASFDFTAPDISKYQTNSVLSEYLPGGATIKYYSYTQNSDIYGFVLMQNPQTDINVSFSVLNGSVLSESEFLSQLGSLSQKIYWYLLAQ